MIDFMGKKKWFFIASGIITLVGVIFLLAFGMNRGIEFTGGSQITIHFEREVAQADLRAEMSSLGYNNAVVQKTGEGDFLVTTEQLSDEDVANIQAALAERFGEQPSIGEPYTVSGRIASEIEGKASIAVFVAAIGIVLYITWAFRKLTKPFRYGVCSIIALSHDVIVVLGVFSILGFLFNVQIDAMFISGVLTIIGYSVNDTIVVFDRIRENLLKNPGAPLEVMVNYSINETLARSLNTSLTTLFAILALLVLGGATLHNFMLCLLIGVITGTYSSFAIASPLLIVWERGTFSRFFRRLIPKRMPARG